MSLSKPLCITPVAPTTTGTISILVNLHNVLISTAKLLYARILLRRLRHTLLSFSTATSIMSALLFVLLITIMSGLLCCRAWSVWTVKFHKILGFAFSLTVRGWCWYHAVWFSLKSNSFKRRLCTYLHTLSCLCRYLLEPSLCNQTWYGELFQLLVDTTNNDRYLWCGGSFIEYIVL